MSSTKGPRLIFSTYHPGVSSLFFGAAILLTMFALHPVYAVIALVTSHLCEVTSRGAGATFASLKYRAILFVTVLVISPLLNPLGDTTLFTVFSRPITLEALTYAFCAASMLTSVLSWFASAESVVTNDRFLALFSRTAPTIALLVSMVFRQVPQMIARAGEIRAARHGLYGGSLSSVSEKTRESLKVASVLMSWEMEDSLETAASMRARGYSDTKRTAYAPFTFTLRDGKLTAYLAVMIAASAALAFIALAQFHFYPVMPHLTLWWGYIPFALLLLTPVFVSVRGWLEWTLSAQSA